MSFASELQETSAVLRSLLKRSVSGDLGSILGWTRGPLVETGGAPVLLTGMGSSYFAAHYAACLLEHSGIPALAVDTGDLLDAHPALITTTDRKVVISQSGRSGEVLDLIRRRGEDHDDRWLAVTNDPDSPLGQAGDVVIDLGAGREDMTTSKTFFATLAALALVVDPLRSGDSWGVASGLTALADAFDAALASGPSEEAKRLADRIEAGGSLVLVGKDLTYGAAQQAALILQEAIHADAVGLTYGQWLHGPSERANPSLTVVAFPGLVPSPVTERTLVDSAAHGAEILRLPTPDVPAWRLPFDSLLPVYQAMLLVGQRRGTPVGELSHKVTDY